MQKPKNNPIPGERTLRHSDVGNTTTCTIHGYGFTKTEVICRDKLKPVCGECFNAGYGTLPEPDWLDPFCKQAGDCAGAVGANRCRQCRQPKCDKHMFVNGPYGICRDCNNIPALEELKKRPALHSRQLCNSNGCLEFVTDFCKACETGYCRACMNGPQDDGLCRHCAKMLGRS